MLISLLETTDFMRLRSVRIEPSADADYILIGGDNANGKTSVLTALKAALGGASEAPEDPVRHGAEVSETFVALEDGKSKITVRRVFHADGSASKVEVRDELGALKKPQDVLNKLIGARFMDPLAFLALKSGEQRARLLTLVDGDGAIAKLDAHRSRVFDRRTEIGRELRKLTSTIDSTIAVDPAAEIDVSALSQELATLGDAIGEYRSRMQKHDEARRNTESLARQLRTAEAAFDKAKADHQRAMLLHSDAIDAEMAARAAVEASPGVGGAEVRRDAIHAEIKMAVEHNRSVAAIRAQHVQRARLEDQAAAVAAEHGQREAELEQIDAQKATALAAAALPVAGLGVTETAVTFNGVPLAQASSAEQLRVAVAIAAAVHPTLRDIFVRDGSLLDDTMLVALVTEARAAGVRLWIERVGSRDPGAIIIHDGKIAEPGAAQVELFR